ncbi:HAMP domain-containing sensor histidine kinase [Methyloglobulus sp.]|uniref:sensor histidine kinase n=1 Tax=Methyloglobulus sp. TaxID=2518622 RepID=UPI0032B84EAA
MPTNTSTMIYPCPFSKGYGMPASQAWQLLKIFYIYRFVLACSIALLFYFRFEPLSATSYDGYLYKYTSFAYLILTVILGICIFWRVLGYSLLAQLLIFTDIIMLTLLMFASGGVKSGVGILLAVSVAAGGLLIGGRCALVFAAIASLAILSEEMYAAQNLLFAKTSYTYAGMLGATYFAIAMLSLVLARRSEQMLLLADQQQLTILRLEELNQYIIQHLQSGIIITDEHQIIQMANQAALRLVNLCEMPEKLIEISRHLSQTFQNWLHTPEQNVAMLQLSGKAEIQSRFMTLPTQSQVFFMIILEDIALYNQRLQQSKLASLGRLTASIAHEIRNPLGAISHAGQLLSESAQLTSQDLRLTNIIQTNSSRVNQIIEDILNLSKRTDSSREKIDLAQWLNDYLDNFYIEYTNATAHVFKLSLSNIPMWVFIDPGHLKQIMDNLCQNALRYGNPELGSILVRMQYDRHEPCIEVIDNGSGISPEHLKQLFEPFFTTSTRGTGLGLYISRELAELNQAKLSYYLTDENRSCFRLCLRDANLTTIEL